MTPEQIQILIDDQDIWTENSIAYDTSKFVFLESINGKYKHFAINNKWNLLIENIYNKYLGFWIYEDEDITVFKQTISNKVLLLYPTIEEKKLFYKEQLNNQHSKLKEIYKDLDEYGIDCVLSWWKHYVFDYNEINLLEVIKFKILTGGSIESFPPLKSLTSENWAALDTIFFENEMYQHYQIARIWENMKYLQNLIVNMESDIQNDAPLKMANKENSTSRIDNVSNMFCELMPISFVEDYFNKLTQTRSKNGKLFLENCQLKNFINRAFLGDDFIKEETFNHTNREKLFIVKLFYNFYLLATNPTNNFEKTSSCKEKYIKLLTNNFTNWSYEKIEKNFGNKVKREW